MPNGRCSWYVPNQSGKQRALRSLAIRKAFLLTLTALLAAALFTASFLAAALLAAALVSDPAHHATPYARRDV
jgi:hypothetical protein